MRAILAVKRVFSNLSCTFLMARVHIVRLRVLTSDISYKCLLFLWIVVVYLLVCLIMHFTSIVMDFSVFLEERYMQWVFHHLFLAALKITVLLIIIILLVKMSCYRMLFLNWFLFLFWLCFLSCQCHFVCLFFLHSLYCHSRCACLSVFDGAANFFKVMNMIIILIVLFLMRF